MDILWLDHHRCMDTMLVGGKVANLSRLAGAFRVPPGYCVTTAALTMAVARGVPLDARDVSIAALPDDLRARIVAAYEQLAAQCGEAEPCVAVRSSAVDEDGGDASFAGQHETYLNIAGRDAMLMAVARCWASAHSRRAHEYRRQHGLPLDCIRLAVLVQRLVAADVSAVVFSANPLTDRRDEVVINASWGLGESIVGGTVTPDTYIIGKRDGAVRERQIAEKRKMTVVVPGGTAEVDVPRLLRTQPTLTDARATAMADLAVALEQTMGYAVDVECAFHGETLYLLQCRPITVLG